MRCNRVSNSINKLWERGVLFINIFEWLVTTVHPVSYLGGNWYLEYIVSFLSKWRLPKDSIYSLQRVISACIVNRWPCDDEDPSSSICPLKLGGEKACGLVWIENHKLGTWKSFGENVGDLIFWWNESSDQQSWGHLLRNKMIINVSMFVRAWNTRLMMCPISRKATFKPTQSIKGSTQRGGTF